MSKPYLAADTGGYAGIDISADWLDAAYHLDDGSSTSLVGSHAPEHRRFANDAEGHAALCRWLTDAGHPARVVTEASGVYGTDLALALHEAEGIEVMILNPRAAKDYRRAHMHRSTPPRWGGRPTRSTRPSSATTPEGCRSPRGNRPKGTPSN